MCTDDEKLNFDYLQIRPACSSKKKKERWRTEE
jgi:hypothetical protein